MTKAEADAFNSLLINEGKIIAFEKALIRAINRAHGAADAGDTGRQKKQLQAAAIFAAELGFLVSDEASLREHLVKVLKVTAFPKLTVTPHDFLALQQDLSEHELPDFLQKAPLQLGADEDNIEAIVDSFLAQNINEVAGTFPEKFADPVLILALRELAAALNPAE